MPDWCMQRLIIMPSDETDSTTKHITDFLDDFETEWRNNAFAPEEGGWLPTIWMQEGVDPSLWKETTEWSEGYHASPMGTTFKPFDEGLGGPIQGRRVVANMTVIRPSLTQPNGYIEFKGKWRATFEAPELKSISSAYPKVKIVLDFAEKNKDIAGRAMCHAGNVHYADAVEMLAISRRPGFKALWQKSG